MGWLLGILGFTGIAGLALRFLAPGAFAAVRAFLSAIPPKVWIAIAAVALLVGGYFLHGHQVKKAHDAAYQSGQADQLKADNARWDAEHKAALAWRAKAEATAAAISKDERDRHEQDLRSIAARADDQRVRGPGAAAAACGRQGGDSRVSAGAGRSGATSGSADAGVDRVSATEGLAIVSWDDLVGWAATADGWRSEALAWRAWYPRQAEENARARGEAGKP